MLPAEATKAFDQVTSTAFTFILIMLIGSAAGMLLARQNGGKSKLKRQVIFSIASTCGLFIAAYFALSKLQGG